MSWVLPWDSSLKIQDTVKYNIRNKNSFCPFPPAGKKTDEVIIPQFHLYCKYFAKKNIVCKSTARLFSRQLSDFLTKSAEHIIMKLFSKQKNRRTACSANRHNPRLPDKNRRSEPVSARHVDALVKTSFRTNRKKEPACIIPHWPLRSF